MYGPPCEIEHRPIMWQRVRRRHINSLLTEGMASQQQTVSKIALSPKGEWEKHSGDRTREEPELRLKELGPDIEHFRINIGAADSRGY